MKRLFILSMVLVAALGLNAQNSVLHIRNFDNAVCRLVIDGYHVNNRSQMVTVDNVGAGYHNIELYATTYYGRRTQEALVYRGSIFIDRSSEIYAVINRAHRIEIERQLVLRPNSHDYDNHCDNNGHGNHHNDNHGNHGYPYYGAPEHHDDAHYDVPGYGYNDPYHYNQPMNENSFRSLLGAIQNASFESNRSSIAKQAIQSNYFTSAQVVQLLNQFWFEDTKLDIAKAAFNKVIDQENYYLVNNAFNFSSSVDELAQYLKY